MTSVLISADLVPGIVAECTFSNGKLPAIVQLIGNNIEITLLDSRPPETPHPQHGDDPRLESGAGQHNDSENKIAPPLNGNAPLPPGPDHPTPGAPTDLIPPEGPPLQIGLPLHPNVLQPPGPGATGPIRTPIKIEHRPLVVRLLHIDERRGHGHVCIGRVVRRVEIDGTLAQLRELRDWIQLNIPELSAVGAFDLTSCVSQPGITLSASSLLAQLAGVNERALAREAPIS
jgi:hypothetical protein